MQARQAQLLGTAFVKWLLYNLSQTKREKLNSAEGRVSCFVIPEHVINVTASQDCPSLGQASKSIFVMIQRGNTFLKE